MKILRKSLRLKPLPKKNLPEVHHGRLNEISFAVCPGQKNAFQYNRKAQIATDSISKLQAAPNRTKWQQQRPNLQNNPQTTYNPKQVTRHHNINNNYSRILSADSGEETVSLNRVVVQAPATTANLGPGFDVFGLALAAPRA